MAEQNSTCIHCGALFHRNNYEITHGQNKCCSKACGIAHKTRPLADRFWDKVQKTDGCWIWTGSRRNGYGQIAKSRSLPIKATTVSWEIHYGPVPDGMWLLHRCDNPPCVRPDHLFLGTSTDNVRDMVRKGRHGHATYITYQGESLTLSGLALLLGVSPGTVCDQYRLQHLTVDQIVERSRNA